MEIKGDNGELAAREKDRAWRSGRHGDGDKHRSGSRDRDKEGFHGRDSTRHGSRERDMERSDRRERRNDEVHERERDRDRDKERSRDKDQEKNYHRDHDREGERGVDRSYDHDRDRGREHGRDRGREHEKRRESESRRERDAEHDYERGRVHDKSHDHARHRERDHERARDGDRLHGRSKVHDRNHEPGLDRELSEERKKEKNRDRSKDGEEKVKEKEKDKERDGLEIEKSREKHKDRDVEKEPNGYRDQSRARDNETFASKNKEGDKDGKLEEESSDELNVKPSGLHYSSSDLKDRIKKMKDERLKANSEASEISSWVNKSRKLEEKKHSNGKALLLTKALQEQDTILADDEDAETVGHGGKDLAGVKILHGLDKVIEGGAVVLTLKDQAILADGSINEEVDMLENVEIGEQRQRDDAYRASKKQTGTYYDKFSEDNNSKKVILPQYDDPIEDEGVTLDETGNFSGEAEKKLEELRRRISGGSLTKSYEDLTTSGKVTSDYFTADEILQFRRPKKKKSLRKKDKLDLDALEAEAVTFGLGSEDHGSRKDLKRQAVREEQEKAEAISRKDAYQAAYAKAEEASKVLRQDLKQTSTPDDLVFGEDYEHLQKSLEQARKLSLKKQDEATVSAAEAVALLVASLKKENPENLDPPRDMEENKIVITEMEEFVLGLHLNEDSYKPESGDVFKDDDVLDSFEMEIETQAGGWAEVTETIKDDQPAKEEMKDVASDEIIHEPAVGKGLAGALKLLKDRGTLNEGIDWGGRNMDKRKSKLVGINEGPEEIHIERTDEFGRIMTPKESFRILSHKFHGKAPGKMKQEKRMKEYKESLKKKQMKASDTPLMTMERMMEAQARLKTPYLVLSGNVKPGQTSDPNSGFATVEKEHLGSLTPMLGDKKVEHFLGIKRGAGAGNMPPPPPKKPRI